MTMVVNTPEQQDLISGGGVGLLDCHDKKWLIFF